MADADETQGDCGGLCSGPGFWLLLGGIAVAIVGLDAMTGGKVLSWLPVPALFGSARPEADSSAGD